MRIQIISILTGFLVRMLGFAAVGTSLAARREGRWLPVLHVDDVRARFRARFPYSALEILEIDRKPREYVPPACVLAVCRGSRGRESRDNCDRQNTFPCDIALSEYERPGERSNNFVRLDIAAAATQPSATSAFRNSSKMTVSIFPTYLWMTT